MIEAVDWYVCMEVVKVSRGTFGVDENELHIKCKEQEERKKLFNWISFTSLLQSPFAAVIFLLLVAIGNYRIYQTPLISKLDRKFMQHKKHDKICT